MSDPTIQQLRYAVAVADAGHFGRAALVCRVSQPALSAQIQRLERGLGVQLFERLPRQVIITPAGADLIERARRVLREVEDLVDAAGTTVIPSPAPFASASSRRSRPTCSRRCCRRSATRSLDSPSTCARSAPTS